MVREIVAARAPDDSVVAVDGGPQVVTVTVSAPARVSLLPALPGARARATAAWEPGARP